MNIARITTLLALSLQASLAMAGDISRFSQTEFDRLAAQGKPVLLDVAANWCPTCRQQKPVIEHLMKQPAYKDVSTLTIDFDTDRAALKKFKVTSQSTLIAFKGAREVGRSIGDTTPAGIEDLIRKAAD